MSQKLSQAEFARHLGVRRSYVTQLKQTGRLVIDENGLIDVDASTARIAATADPGKQAVAARHAQQRGGELPSAPLADNAPERAPESLEEPEAPGTPDYQKARARKEEANAQLAEIEVAKQAASLFDASEVIAAVADAGAIFRTSLDSRRPLLVSQLAVLSDEAEVRLLLEEQDEYLLTELAAKLTTAGRES